MYHDKGDDEGMHKARCWRAALSSLGSILLRYLQIRGSLEVLQSVPWEFAVVCLIVVLGTELRALHMLIKHSAAELHL